MTPDLLAEAATLGALLLDPDARTRVCWLRAEDFTDPWHQQLHRVIAEDTAAGRGSDPAILGAALRDRLGPRRADLHRIAGVLAFTPIRPQPDRYARMVLETSLRRGAATQPLLWRAGAAQAAATGTRDPLAEAVALVHTHVDAGLHRWTHATGATVGTAARHNVDARRAAAKRAHPASGGRPSSAARPAPGDERAPAGQRGLVGQAVARSGQSASEEHLAGVLLGADRYLAAQPVGDPERETADERDLVAALVNRPSAVPGVAGWLRPQDLRDPAWAVVYAAVVDLVDRGEPVDAVTVAWQVHAAAPRTGPGPEPDELLAAVDAARGADPRWLARQVAGDLTRRTAEQAAAALHAAVANPGVTVPDLLHTTRLLADTVLAAARGLPTSGHPAATAPVPVTRPHLTLLTPVPNIGHPASAVAR